MIAAGGCQCGRGRYAAVLTDDDEYLCQCRMCQRAAGGTPPTYEGDGSDHMDLTVGSLDDPIVVRPPLVTGVESRRDVWVDTSGLPATRTDDNADITAKWIAACGQLPD